MEQHPFHLEWVTYVKVNNVFGTPFISLGGTTNNTIELFNQRSTNPNIITDRGIKIGQARVYSYGASDASYTGGSTQFDLHLYDIQTYTIIKFSDVSMMAAGSRIRGLSSGAIGFVADTASNPNEKSLLQTTGTFVEGEQVIVDEKISNIPPSIISIDAYTTDDIKSVFQDSDHKLVFTIHCASSTSVTIFSLADTLQW